MAQNTEVIEETVNNALQVPYGAAHGDSLPDLGNDTADLLGEEPREIIQKKVRKRRASDVQRKLEEMMGEQERMMTRIVDLERIVNEQRKEILTIKAHRV